MCNLYLSAEMKLEITEIEDFLREALIMRQFDHPNVLYSLGISVHDEKACVVLPLMSNGDLRTLLIQQRLVTFIQTPFSKRHCR